jgi:hypothetical protein
MESRQSAVPITEHHSCNHTQILNYWTCYNAHYLLTFCSLQHIRSEHEQKQLWPMSLYCPRNSKAMKTSQQLVLLLAYEPITSYCNIQIFSDYVYISLGHISIRWIKVKLSLCLTNQALCHEGVWGSSNISLKISSRGSSALHLIHKVTTNAMRQIPL